SRKFFGNLLETPLRIDLPDEAGGAGIATENEARFRRKRFERWGRRLGRRLIDHAFTGESHRCLLRLAALRVYADVTILRAALLFIACRIDIERHQLLCVGGFLNMR